MSTGQSLALPVVTTIVPTSAVLPPITLPGLTTWTVNDPSLVPDPFVICSQGWLAVAVQLLPAPVKVTDTVGWPGVTVPNAAVAPALVALNESHAGPTLNLPLTFNVATLLVVDPAILVTTH